jgi:CRP-like cAMP-binding protein
MLNVWRSAGRFPLPSAAGHVSFYRYASPLRSARLFSVIERSIEDPDQQISDLPGGRVAFKALSLPARLWVIVEGKARLIFPAEGWRPGNSRVTDPHELIGLTETLAGIPYSATLQTISKCRFYSVQRLDLIRLLSVDRSLREDLLLTFATGLS